MLGFQAECHQSPFTLFVINGNATVVSVGVEINNPMLDK